MHAGGQFLNLIQAWTGQKRKAKSHLIGWLFVFKAKSSITSGSPSLSKQDGPTEKLSNFCVFPAVVGKNSSSLCP